MIAVSKPYDEKPATVGNGSMFGLPAASKEQVQLAVRRLLRLETPPRPSHVADALALAITGFSRLGGKLP